MLDFSSNLVFELKAELRIEHESAHRAQTVLLIILTYQISEIAIKCLFFRETLPEDYFSGGVVCGKPKYHVLFSLLVLG